MVWANERLCGGEYRLREWANKATGCHSCTFSIEIIIPTTVISPGIFQEAARANVEKKHQNLFKLMNTKYFQH